MKNVICLALVGALSSAIVSAAVADTVVDQKCSMILNGNLTQMIRNAAKTSSEKIGGSAVMKTNCPQFAKLSDEQQQTAVVRFLAIYTYQQTACNPHAGATSQPGQTGGLKGGLFWQTLSATDRNRTAHGTPCGFRDWTDLNQVNCAVYGISMLARNSTADGLSEMPKKMRLKIEEQMKDTLPNCFEDTSTAGPAQKPSSASKKSHSVMSPGSTLHPPRLRSQNFSTVMGAR